MDPPEVHVFEVVDDGLDGFGFVSHFRGKRVLEAATDALRRLMSRGGDSGLLPGDHQAAMRIHIQKLERRVDDLVKVIDDAVCLIKAAMECSVRNEVHLKRIENSVSAIDLKVEEAVTTAKAAHEFALNNQLLSKEILSSIKNSIEALAEVLKTANPSKKETWIENYDTVLKNVEIVFSVPKRIDEMVKLVVFYIGALESILFLFGVPSKKVQELPMKLEDLPEKCNGLFFSNGFYSEIGQKARDLLYGNFNSGLNVVLSAKATNEAFVSTAIMMNIGDITDDIRLQIMNEDVKVDLQASVQANVITTTVNESSVPGLKYVLSVPIPMNYLEGKLRYLHTHGGVTAGACFLGRSTFSLSGIFGTKAFAFGGDVSFDAVNRDLTKCNVGMGISNSDLSVAFSLHNKGDLFTASLFRKWRSTAFGAEFKYCSSTKKNKLTVGFQKALDPFSTIKARLNDNLVASAVILNQWSPRSLFTLCFEVDLKAPQMAPRVGLSFVFKA